MGWSRRRRTRVEPLKLDVAERLTTVRRLLWGVETQEFATLDDRGTVRRWLHEQQQEQRDQTVIVHRSWGSVCTAASHGRPPDTVMMAHREDKWYEAVAGGGTDRRPRRLTPDQIERVMLDALTSPGPPTWPGWRPL